MRLPEPEAESEGPNMTPVIDLVFTLLIFFLVATQFQQQERELDVALPDVAQAQSLSQTQDLIVNITKEGKYLVVQREYSEDELGELLRKSAQNNPHQKVLIRGDGRTAWRYGVRVMGLCNQAKIEDYRVAALEKE